MSLGLETAQALHALSDPVRLRILDHLAQAPAGVTELSGQLPITRQGTAKHLAVLRDADLVRGERVGRETRYRVHAATVRDTADALATAADRWSRQLALLKQAAEDGAIP